MYQIFESSLYLLYEKSRLPSNVTVDDVDEPTNLPSTNKIEKTKEKNPVISINDDPEIDPTSEIDPEIEDTETASQEKTQAIQKFILYNKLRELQYKLDNANVITNYKNKDELVKFNKFLSYVIQFFSIFDYAQASQITQRLLDEFKKIK